MTKSILVAIAVLSSVAAAEPITIKGSTTAFSLVQRWADEFRKQKPDAQITVTAGGSGYGIAALIANAADVAMSSREIKDSEQDKLRSRFNSPAIELPVTKDALAIYVNKANPVVAISIEQLKGIYSGKLSNWKQVGGIDAPIVAYAPASGNGTHGWFQEHVLEGGDYQNTRTIPGGFAMVTAVFKDPNGVGFGGSALAKGIKLLKIRVGTEEIECNAATMASNKYPLGREVFFYLKKKPAGDLGAFVDFVLSPAGQQIAVAAGFFPLK